MNLAMLSVRRPGGHDYVYQSLLSLMAVGEFPGVIHVFLGNADSSHLEFLAEFPRVELHRMSAEEWGAIAGWKLARRQSYASWKAMTYFADRDEDVCLCEDDVQFDAGFWPKLGESVAELESARTSDYILTAYAYHDFAADQSPERRRLTAKYPHGAFWGAQAMYFPASVLTDFTAHLRHHGVDHDGNPTDLLFRDRSNERDCLYLTVNSLVQHIGQISNAGSPHHTSPTFGRPWPPLFQP